MKTTVIKTDWDRLEVKAAIFSSESLERVQTVDLRDPDIKDAVDRWYVTVWSLSIKPTKSWFTIEQAFKWASLWIVSYNLKSEEEANLYKTWITNFFWQRDIWEVVSFETWKATIEDNEINDIIPEDINEDEVKTQVEVDLIDKKRVWRLKKIKELKQPTWFNILKKFHNDVLIKKLWDKEKWEVDFLSDNLDSDRKEELLLAFSEIDTDTLSTIEANEIEQEAFKRYLQNLWLDVKDVEDDAKWLIAVFKASFIQEFWV